MKGNIMKKLNDEIKTKLTTLTVFKTKWYNRSTTTHF